jgi:hypothetical protein|tara:strand:- start:54 stop:473 length:420 start_codon:yes stop_codon:yes gene_type:complete
MNMPPKFKVVIAGGRTFNNFDMLIGRLDAVLVSKITTHTIVIISGGAQGADLLGERYAELRSYEAERFIPAWKDISVEGAVVRDNKYGKYNAVAGHTRNEKMAQCCDAVVLFWDGISKGTLDMKKRAENHNKPVRVCKY